MTDDIEIRSGGAIAVDTSSLRQMAATFAQLADDCATAEGWLLRAQQAAVAVALPPPFPVVRVDVVEERAQRLAGALRRRAEVYEAVERSVAAGISARWGAGDGSEAADLLAEWTAGRHREVQRQLAGSVAAGGELALAVVAILATVRGLGLGTIARTAAPLSGEPPPVEVIRLAQESTSPPGGLVDLAERMPGADGTRVRIETYPDAAGGRQHVIYIAGTQSWEPVSDDPWDMSSNVELYMRRMSASYAAVERMLADAGVHEGDAVHIVGHSQGGMLATHLARQGELDVRSLVTFASPVQAELPDDVMQVTLRHADDAVAALAAGGLPTVAGSPDSFIVERVVDPVPRLSDLKMEVHQMDAYRQTAELADASGDPRVAELHGRLASLGPSSPASGGSGMGGAAAGGGAATAGAAASLYGARRETVSRPLAPGLPGERRGSGTS